MPFVGRGEARIWYTVQGSGFPVLTLAPGGMRPSVPLWEMARDQGRRRVLGRLGALCDEGQGGACQYGQAA